MLCARLARHTFTMHSARLQPASWCSVLHTQNHLRHPSEQCREGKVASVHIMVVQELIAGLADDDPLCQTQVRCFTPMQARSWGLHVVLMFQLTCYSVDHV